MTRRVSRKVKRRVAVFAVAAAVISLAYTLSGCAPPWKVVDLQVAESRGPAFKEALADACTKDKITPASELIGASWDRLVVASEGSSWGAINGLLDTDYMRDDQLVYSTFNVFAAQGDRIAVKFTYSSGGDWPPLVLPGSVVSAKSLSVVPRSQAKPEHEAAFKKYPYDCILYSPDDDKF